MRAAVSLSPVRLARTREALQKSHKKVRKRGRTFAELGAACQPHDEALLGQFAREALGAHQGLVTERLGVASPADELEDDLAQAEEHLLERTRVALPAHLEPQGDESARRARQVGRAQP